MLCASVGVRDKWKEPAMIVYAMLAAILLFYIKINYGLAAIFIVFILFVRLVLASPRQSFDKLRMTKERVKRTFDQLADYKKTLLVFGAGLALFVILCLSFHVELVSYIKNSIRLFVNYQDAMHGSYAVTDIIVNIRTAILAVVIGLFVLKIIFSVIRKQVNWDTGLPVAFTAIAFYLFFGNGFTRADPYHFNDFFAVMPFFICSLFYVFELGGWYASHAVALFAVWMSYYAFNQPQIEDDLEYDHANLYLTQYFDAYTHPVIDSMAVWLRLPDAEKAMIGNATVDVLPDQIALAQYNNLNYDPRPEPQSYSAYSWSLDSMNAQHFRDKTRPEYLFMRQGTVDKRYAFWDESYTKATIYLNYNYVENSILNHVLLQAKDHSDSQRIPVFRELSATQRKLGDTVNIDFPPDQIVYMKVDLKYDALGKMNKLLFRASDLAMRLNFTDTSIECKAIPALLRVPVLISHGVLNDADLKNFLMGQVRANRKLKSFVLYAKSEGFKSQYKVSFLSFVNY